MYIIHSLDWLKPILYKSTVHRKPPCLLSCEWINIQLSCGIKCQNQVLNCQQALRLHVYAHKGKMNRTLTHDSCWLPLVFSNGCYLMLVFHSSYSILYCLFDYPTNRRIYLASFPCLMSLCLSGLSNIAF